MFDDDEDDFLVFSDDENEPEALASGKPPWKVLLVDDEPAIHQVTILALSGVTFAGRELCFLHCYSGAETQTLMAKEPDIALIFLDVVMETEHAGLETARYIRDTLNNHRVRIILRTGQPGSAPETEVIRDYDINDYKTKTELTSAKLETSVISALRGFAELDRSETLRNALDRQLQCTSQLMTTNGQHALQLGLLPNLIETLPLVQAFEPKPKLALLQFNDEQIQQLSPENDDPETTDSQDVALSIAIPTNMLVELREQLSNGVHTSVLNQEFALLLLCHFENGSSLYLAVQYENMIEEEEAKWLMNLAHSIELVCNNICLRESLANINQDLEQKVIARTKDFQAACERAEQANQAKSNFLSNMSHEIRTPMNAILGFAQIMERSSDVSSQQSVTLTKIIKAGQHLLEIINDVLEISKIEAGAAQLNLNDFELVSLLTDIGQMFQIRCEQKKLAWSFTNHCQPQVYVYGDQGKVRQILINLLGNSVKFTDSGAISLTLSQLSAHQYKFEVKDTGPGISSQEQQTLFTNFTQGAAGQEKGGTGLGLAISAKQIEMMGGNLQLESQVGEGSHFYFSLHLPEGQANAVYSGESEIDQLTVKTGIKFRALCVDDVTENSEVLGGLLTSCDIEVSYAENGQQAIELIQNQHFDVVFMDLLMPVMRGDEAIKIIRGELNYSQLICIAVSAFSLSHEIQHYLSIGFNQFIAKPFKFSDVYRALLTFFPDQFNVLNRSHEQEQQAQSVQINIAELTLNSALLAELKSSVAINRSSHVKKLLIADAQQHVEHKPYIEYLIQMIDRFDTEGLIQALGEVNDEQ